MNGRDNLFQPDPQAASQAAEKIIQTFFYNTLVDFITRSGTYFHYSRESLPHLLRDGIAHILSIILDNSSGMSGIRLPGYNVNIYRQNCPERYRPLYDALMQLKAKPHVQPLLAGVASQIMLLPTFQELNPAQHLLEMAGLANPVLLFEPITTEEIRETFYNLMFAQTEIAIKNGWLPLQKVLGQKDIIYTALPGLTILAALEASKRHDGIPLICGKVINSHNCPQEENFPQFVASILKIREKYLTLREEELYIIRHKLCCNKEVPDHLKRFDTTELMEFKAVVYGMAATISQSRIFLQMTPVVFSECCKLFADEKQPISPGPGRK